MKPQEYRNDKSFGDRVLNGTEPMEENKILTQEEVTNLGKHRDRSNRWSERTMVIDAVRFDCVAESHAALLSLLQKRQELLQVAKCPNCDGSGAIQVQTYRPATFVSRDMATDAGMPELEGSIYQDEAQDFDYEPCQWCDERKQALAAFPTELNPTDAALVSEERNSE